MMKFYIGNDHRGYYLAKELGAWLAEQGYEVEFTGSFDNKSTDYPDWAKALGKKIAAVTGGRGVEESGALGIGICGSGVGIAMALNKMKAVRATPLWHPHIAEFAKKHNDANVVTFSADLQTLPMIETLLQIFLDARFEGGRHLRRIDKLRRLEEEQS